MRAFSLLSFASIQVCNKRVGCILEPVLANLIGFKCFVMESVGLWTEAGESIKNATPPRLGRVGPAMGDRPAPIEKVAVPEKMALFLHAAVTSPGRQQHHGASSHEAPAANITPRTTTARNKQQHLPVSPGACLCSPTVHEGSFRCRLHRGSGSGSGLHEMKMSKKAGV